MMKSDDLITLDQFIDKEYGIKGGPKREKFEQGYLEFKLGAMIHEAPMAKGLTQSELADKCGTTKSYISKAENDIKDVRV